MTDEKNLEMMEEDEWTVTLTLDNDEEVECLVITVFEAAGRDYIALLPMEQSEEEEGEVYLYRYIEREDGEPDLENIESDEEYERISQIFIDRLDADYDDEDEDEAQQSE